MIQEEIKNKLKQLTSHQFLEITTRGNTAIEAAFSVVKKGETILIPEEGGWLHYKRAPPKLGLKVKGVKCEEAKINLADLKEKLTGKPAALLYQNPGGYYAEQPDEEIYELCKKNNCLAMVDVSGALGTELCEGNNADLLVGSFGEGKLVEAHVGGFVSCKNKELFEKLNILKLNDEKKLKIILEKINQLPSRVDFLKKKIKKIKEELAQFNLVRPKDLGFVVVVKFSTPDEKEKIINYCKNHQLEWRECPRYIRIKEKAISIEVKKLKNGHG